jgi:hypothetical protein
VQMVHHRKLRLFGCSIRSKRTLNFASYHLLTSLLGAVFFDKVPLWYLALNILDSLEVR